MGDIIIGFGTTVSFGGCATSAQWGYNPNPQKLYCLGSSLPDSVVLKPTETFSITVYGDSESGNTYLTSISEQCVGVNTIAASVSPVSCNGTAEGVSGNWYVTSYSYSKADPQVAGQETWSLMHWVSGGGVATIPTTVLRTSAEGEASNASKVGITFDTLAVASQTTGTTGSVSAGALGIAASKTYGTVSNVGPSGSVVGDVEEGSATMAYQPLWI